MLLIYRFLINIILILSPLIIIFRILKKKESLKRFKEKLCLPTRKRNKGNLVWLHGASVGELNSIIPLVYEFEKNDQINQILVTSNTLSSSEIIKYYKFKKLTHQFFPIDSNFMTKIFLNYWKPSCAFFIDSEVWPNMICSLSKKKIPIVLLNGRITKKTYNRWKLYNSFAKFIFKKFDLCLASSKDSFKFLKKLGVNNLKLVGNLKFTKFKNEKDLINKKLKKFIKSKKVWCASSTHESEEIFCGKIHNILKKKYNNLLTIIIPRHVHRAKLIQKNLENLGLKVHIHSSKIKIENNLDVYLVDKFGLTKSFYQNTKNVFLGGSLMNHGGQNPIEAIRYGCNILHGPNISNFDEIYNLTEELKVSHKVNSLNDAVLILRTLFNQKKSFNDVKKKFELMGKDILYKTYKEIKPFI
jgi:3-deoxy-D-manno-octulosonic-acid transferase